MNKRIKAFTLIELTVVLLIMALSMSIVMPKLNTATDQHSLLKASAGKIAGIAEYAQQQAACTHLMFFLNIDCQNGAYWITSQGSDGMSTPVKSSFNLNGQLPEGIKFADVKLQGINSSLHNTVAIGFSPQGWADPAQILMTCISGETIEIIVDEFSGQIETYVAKEMN